MNPLDARRRLLGRNVYKKTVEGNPAIAQGSLARRYPGITMQGWTEQAQYEGNQLLPLPVGKVIESESGNNTLTVTESGVNLNITESTTTAYTNDIYVFGNSQYNIEVGYEDASAYIPQGLYTLLNDTITNLEVFLSVWRNGVKIDLISSATTRPANFTIMDGDKIRLGIRPKGTLEINNMMLMVIKQTLPSTTPFEPYTGGQPSPSPDYPQPITNAGNYNEETQKYQYEVKLTGANLFSPDSESVEGTYLGFPLHNKGVVSLILYEKNPDIDISGINFGFTVNGVNGDNGANWIIIGGQHSGDGVSYSVDNVYISVYPKNKLETVLERYDVMVNYGTEPLPYQPYKEQTVTLTSARPLTKWDKLEKRNGQWGWVYKSGTYTMTGEENFLSSADTYHGEITSDAWCLVDGMFAKVWTPYDAPGGYCEKLYWSQGLWEKDGLVAFTYNVTQIHIRLKNSDTGVTAEDTLTDVANKIKAYVAQQYEEGNPFIFWYETTEETFVPLSSSEQELMNALYTFRPTTVLSNDCECNMTLTYKTKKSLQPVSGGGIRKPSNVTSYFTFGVKWNQINKIVLKASGITEKQNIFFCGEGAKQPWIGLDNAGVLSYLGLKNGICNLTSDDILNGQFHEIIFEFDICGSELNIVNVWDLSWSKNIVYHEIAFYNGDELLADYVPYYKGAGYMLDKKNNVVIRATNPDDYEFA